MGLRFRKSVKIAPGVKVNFNKKSVGVSVGAKGAHVSVNSSGRKTTSVGIPGTGLSYVTTTSTKSKQKSCRKAAASSSENAENRAAEERAAEYSRKAKNVKTNKTIIQVFGWILAVLFLVLGLVYPVCFVFCALCVFAAIKARKSWRKTYDDLIHMAEEELAQADEEETLTESMPSTEKNPPA